VRAKNNPQCCVGRGGAVGRIAPPSRRWNEAILITPAGGTTDVRGLKVNCVPTDAESSSFGVMRCVQQAIISWSLLNRQMLPQMSPTGLVSGVPRVPALIMRMTWSGKPGPDRGLFAK
jgi:hypothetical protein